MALQPQRRRPEVVRADSHRRLDDKRESLTAIRLRMRWFPSVFGSVASEARVQVRVYDEATKTHTHTLWYCDPLLSCGCGGRAKKPGTDILQGALLQWRLGQVQAGAHQPCLLS